VEVDEVEATSPPDSPLLKMYQRIRIRRIKGANGII